MPQESDSSYLKNGEVFLYFSKLLSIFFIRTPVLESGERILWFVIYKNADKGNPFNIVHFFSVPHYGMSVYVK